MFKRKVPSTIYQLTIYRFELKTVKKHLLLLLCSSMIIFGCTNVQLDNASASGVTVGIDGEEYPVAAGATEEISLDAGSHHVTVKTVTGDIRVDTTIEVKSGGVINAGGTTYVLWKVWYGIQQDREILLKEDWVTIDSVRYYGDLTVFTGEDVYMESRWDKGLDEELPESQPLMQNKDYSIIAKLFRLEDFHEEYERSTGS